MKSKKLHIVFVDFDDIKNPLLSGGQALATFEVAKRLVKRGNRVTVLCSRFPGSKDSKNNGIYYKHIGLGSTNIRKNNAVYFFALPLALKKIKADIIIECFTAPISTCLSPLYTKIPVIGMPTMFEAKEFSKKYHIPFHLVEAAGAKFYKYFLAYSPINKIKMESLNSKIYTRIIPNGVSEDFFKIKTKDGNYMLFIGRIDINQKGLDILIRAWKKENPKKIRLVIAGNGPKDEEEKLVALIKKNKLENTVSFIGRIDGKEKEKLIAESFCGMYPSRFEDFPLVPLEFTGMGKPLICFDIEGLKWVSKDVSIKAKPFSDTSLAQAIRDMTKDKDLRAILRKNSKPFARKYGWNEISKEYEKYCFDVLDMERTKGVLA